MPDVTLVCIDCRDPQDGAYALALSCQGLAWSAVKLFSHEPPAWMPAAADWVQVPKLDAHGYNCFVLRELFRHVDTSHVLIVQSDGWVLHPDAWDDAWLEWDYIGAPWPQHFRFARFSVVGNGGFSLRSRRLLEHVSTLDLTEHTRRYTRAMEDLFLCVDQRSSLEAAGFRFASPEVAGRFAFESPSQWASDRPFGFHGKRTPETAARCSDLRRLGESLRLRALV